MKRWAALIVVSFMVVVLGLTLEGGRSGTGLSGTVSGGIYEDKAVKTAMGTDFSSAKEITGNGSLKGVGHESINIRGDNSHSQGAAVAGEPVATEPVLESKVQEKVVYLTFDDGPNTKVTPRVLEVLDRYGVKATFFVIGTSVEQNPEVFRQIVEKGHGVGNHTYSHKYEDIYGSQEHFLNSLKKNDEVLFQIAGVKTNMYRDPGGKLRTDLHFQEFLAQSGYQRAGWNIESYDSRTPRHGPDKILRDVVEQVEVRKDLWGNLIIILHDSPSHENTLLALPGIIEYLLARDFDFKKL